jgi:hypothetical protein
MTVTMTVNSMNLNDKNDDISAVGKAFTAFRGEHSHLQKRQLSQSLPDGEMGQLPLLVLEQPPRGPLGADRGGHCRQQITW